MRSTFPKTLFSQHQISRFWLITVVMLSFTSVSIVSSSAAQGIVEVKSLPTKMVLIDDSLLILAENYLGLEFFNVSDVNNPVKLADYFYPQTTTNLTYPSWRFPYVQDFVVKGQYLYLASSAWGLEIVDISDPNNPTQVGRYDDGGSVG